MTDLVLTGIDGSNPLGFLAALGALEVATCQAASARLRWAEEGVWRPVLGCEGADIDTLCTWIEADLVACRSEPALDLEYDGKRDLKPPPGEYHRYLERLAADASQEERRGVDWAAAFASDVIVDNNGNTKPTALHFTAGQQQFLKMVQELLAGIERDDIRRALCDPWHGYRQLPVMGWDATDSRAYALRASNPSTDKKLGIPAADWLALRALSFVPVAPIGKRLHTTGCIGDWKTGAFRWGLWTVSLTRDVIRSQMRLDLAGMSKEERNARGIGVVFRCGIRRSDQGGYGNFDPAAVI